MTKNLEKEFDLPSMEEVIQKAKENHDEEAISKTEDDATETRKEEVQTQVDKQSEEESGKSSEADTQSIIKALTLAEKIDRALPQVTGLDAEDVDMDTYSTEAMKSYKDLMDLGMNVEVRHSGKLFEVASSMLKNAVEAKNAKLEKKLRMVELQLKKQRVDQLGRGEGSSVDIVEGEGYVIGERNQLLKQIIDRVQDDKSKD
jgi:tartrate dehydratase alpha subunit/fumarate hydratase class I-like protein